MEKICIMCGNHASYIDKETNEKLCESCVRINEGIHNSNGKRGKYKKC